MESELTSKIMQLIRSGLTPENACLAHGLTRKEIEALESDKDFIASVEQAEAQGQALMFQKITAEGGWVGAKWILEFKEKQRAQEQAARMALANHAGRNAIRIDTTKSVKVIEYDPDLE